MMVNIVSLCGMATVLRYLVIHYSVVSLRKFLDNLSVSEL